MASITEKEDKVDDGEDEIKNIYDICGIPGLFKHILIFLKVKSILKWHARMEIYLRKSHPA